MSWHQKPIWSEGLFLRPQHFQQLERYLEATGRGQVAGLQQFFWGFTSLKIDISALALGRVVVHQGKGVMPDGTPFNFPDEDQVPMALDVPETLKDERIMLAIPIERQGTQDNIYEERKDALARYTVVEQKIADISAENGEPSLLQLGNLRLRLVAESQMPDGWVGVGLLKVLEKKKDNQLVIDDNYIAPALFTGSQTLLISYAQELQGLLHQRGEALAHRLSAPGRGGAGEVSDFLMLQLVNRSESVLKHFTEIKSFHPERLFSELLMLAGDLSTFTQEARRPITYPAYDHDDLAGCFAPLMFDMRRSLSSVLEQNAIQIPLHERSYGVRVGLIEDIELLHSANFILAVHADLPTETVRARFPTQVKIGPVEKIRDLVNLHLPGVTLTALPIAPREIPYNVGFNYFQLDTSNELWKMLDRSGGVAVHIAGDFPGLSLEFWAIRGS